MTRSGHAGLVSYMLQQVQQFRSRGEDFAMQHTESEYLAEVEEDLLTSVLQAIPVEKRLRGLTPEERLRGLPPEEQEKILSAIPVEKRLRGLPPEELAAALSEEQAERLWELLRQKRGG